MAEAEQHAVTMEKVTVKVAWCGKNFGGTFGPNVPGAAVFTARTFAGLRQAAEETLRFHVEGMAADGEAVPQWLLCGDYELAYEFEDVAAMLRASGLARSIGLNPSLMRKYKSGLAKKASPAQKDIIQRKLDDIVARLVAVRF